MTSAASGRFSYHMLGKATGSLGTRLGSGGSTRPSQAAEITPRQLPRAEALYRLGSRS